MRVSGAGRFVFVAQWILAVLLPAFFFVGRALVGAELGWLSVVGLIFGVLMIVALLVPPAITLADRDVRAARATRQGYSIASFVLWGALLLGALSVPDEADGGSLDTALTTWTGGVIDEAASRAIFGVAAGVMACAYLAQLVLAIAGALRSRSRATSVSAPPP